MARIKIQDLPVLAELSIEERKGILGGAVATKTRDFDGSKENRANPEDTALQVSLDRSSTKQSLDGASVAAPFVPGGSVISAAMDTAGDTKEDDTSGWRG